MQCCLDAAVLVVLSILFLNPASLVTAFGHHLMPSNGLAKLVIRALKRYYLSALLSQLKFNATYGAAQILAITTQSCVNSTTD